jgi:hypothetical protein
VQKSEWTTRTHIVTQKDDPFGRWICDFRPLNRVARKRATALGDVFTKTRALAGRYWTSGLDAWSGFNQMAASERAKRLLQIITSLGVRQWTVLPFGVTNGPSYFQEFMLHLFGGASANDRDSLPSLLGTDIADLKALLEICIDDIQRGTGEANDHSEESEEGFDRHLESLYRMLERASVADLRLKLSKVFFAQYSLDTLGMVAGMGVVKPDPKILQGIAVWPRPTRLEDVERFLATTVFIREHLSPRYSEVAKPLRDLLTVLQESRRNKTRTVKARYLPPGKAPADGSWPDFWLEEHEQCFHTLKTSSLPQSTSTFQISRVLNLARMFSTFGQMRAIMEWEQVCSKVIPDTLRNTLVATIMF